MLVQAKSITVESLNVNVTINNYIKVTEITIYSYYSDSGELITRTEPLYWVPITGASLTFHRNVGDLADDYLTPKQLAEKLTEWQRLGSVIRRDSLLVNGKYEHISARHYNTKGQKSYTFPLDGSWIYDVSEPKKYFNASAYQIYTISTQYDSDIPYIYVTYFNDDATKIPPRRGTPSSWAMDAVEKSIIYGIVPTKLRTKYTQAITREEFCELAASLYYFINNADIPITKSFTDTKNKSVLEMASLGVVNGTGNGKFSPNEKLTREQAATMLARLASMLYIRGDLPKRRLSYADNKNISPWAVEAIKLMYGTEIMKGVDENRFAPKSNFTREQSITTIMRMREYIINNNNYGY